MKINTRIVALGVFAAMTLTVVPTLRAQPATSLAPAYRVVDLGDLPGGADYSSARKVNNTGQVIGQSTSTDSGSGGAAFIWDATNGLRNLGRVTGDSSAASSINNNGVVVGESYNSYSGWSQAFRWDSVNGIQWLGPGAIAGYPYYGARAINDGGAISYANWSYSGPPSKAYFISGGTATWIGEIYPNAYTLPAGLNNSNEMVGTCGQYHEGPYQAFLWKSGQGMVGLGLLPGYPSSLSVDINDASQVVGYCPSADGTKQAAFIWTSGVGMAQLGSSVIGGSNSYASGISPGGIAVGYCQIAGTNHAVAWAPGQNAVDLSTLVTNLNGWVLLRTAYGINSTGIIVGDGLRTNGVTHAFILYPITVIAPSITNQPASGTVSSGGTATLTVGVAGTPPFTYQWQFNGTNLSGATNASLSIANFSVANAGGYSVTVSNSVAGVTSRIATLASVDIAMFSGVIVNGPLGSNYLIQAASSLAPTIWTTLTNVALPAQPYIYIDYNSPTNAKQFYRALPQ